MDPNPQVWTATVVLTEAIKWLVVGLLGFLAKVAYDATKRLYFRPTGWSMTFPVDDKAGGVSYEDKPAASPAARIELTIRFFSRKSHAIGLHNLAIEFGRTTWFTRTVLHRCDELYCGPGEFIAHQMHFGTLGEFVIEPNAWTTVGVHAFIDDATQLRGSTVWLVGETAEGRTQRWKVTRVADNAW